MLSTENSPWSMLKLGCVTESKLIPSSAMPLVRVYLRASALVSSMFGFPSSCFALLHSFWLFARTRTRATSRQSVRLMPTNARHHGRNQTSLSFALCLPLSLLSRRQSEPSFPMLSHNWFSFVCHQQVKSSFLIESDISCLDISHSNEVYLAATRLSLVGRSNRCFSAEENIDRSWNQYVPTVKIRSISNNICVMQRNEKRQGSSPVTASMKQNTGNQSFSSPTVMGQAWKQIFTRERCTHMLRYCNLTAWCVYVCAGTKIEIKTVIIVRCACVFISFIWYRPIRGHSWSEYRIDTCGSSCLSAAQYRWFELSSP